MNNGIGYHLWIDNKWYGCFKTKDKLLNIVKLFGYLPGVWNIQTNNIEWTDSINNRKAKIEIHIDNNWIFGEDIQ